MVEVYLWSVPEGDITPTDFIDFVIKIRPDDILKYDVEDILINNDYNYASKFWNKYQESNTLPEHVQTKIKEVLGPIIMPSENTFDNLSNFEDYRINIQDVQFSLQQTDDTEEYKRTLDKLYEAFKVYGRGKNREFTYDSTITPIEFIRKVKENRDYYKDLEITTDTQYFEKAKFGGENVTKEHISYYAYEYYKTFMLDPNTLTQKEFIASTETTHEENNPVTEKLNDIIQKISEKTPKDNSEVTEKHG